MDFSVDIVLVDDDFIVWVDMPAVSTYIGLGGGDGVREQVLGIVEEESESHVRRMIWSWHRII